jgi:LCP family protein required for cell wall assembly
MEQKGRSNPGNRINNNQNNPNNSHNNPNRPNNTKNIKNKKRAKLIAIILAALILIFIACVVTIVMLIYDGVHETTSFIDRSEPYVMPSMPSDFLNTSGDTNVSISEGDIVKETGREDAIYRVKPINEDVLNVLLVGKESTNSDSMMIASYNKKTGKIVLGSFLRDSYVPIEKYGWYKLNATFPLGGIGLTINTINQIYDLDIQRYITVDFDGFTKIVDILGGVEIEVSELEAKKLNEAYQLNLSPGMQTLNGEAALGYSRIRRDVGDDYARTARQRKVITAALNKMYNTRNPAKVTKLVSEGIKYVKTNLELDEIYSLITGFMSLQNTNIESIQIPANGMFTNRDDVIIGGRPADVLVLDFDKNKAYIKQKIFG